MSGADLLAGLDPEQRAAAMDLNGPVLIKAGPGSGKTRTITHRIAYGLAQGGYDPMRTMALTFTTRAAGELSRRLSALGAPDISARTFHSAALRQLRHFWPDAVQTAVPRIEPNRVPLIQRALTSAGLTPDADRVQAALNELDWMQGRCLSVKDYLAASADRGVDDLATMPAVLAAYEREKSTAGVIDFSDVLLILIGLLESTSSIRETVRRSYVWFTVDEYQDVSPLQQRLLDLWVGERQQLCAVGDAAQSIYQFAGADPSLLHTFATRYPRAAVHELSTTYRSSPIITASCNSLANRIPHAVTMRPAIGASDMASSGSGEQAPRVQVLQFGDDAGEAAGIASEIAALLTGGHTASEIAVLVRANHQLHAFEAEFRRRGVPFASRAGDRFFDRAEVKEAVTRLRGEARQHPERSAAKLLDTVWQAMGHDAEPPTADRPRARWESLAAIDALYRGRDGDAQVLAADLDARVAGKDPPRPVGVALSTLHSAKGLEWETVFVTGAWEGNLPSARSSQGEALLEERRLAYVGASRAERRLVLSYGRRSGSRQLRAPSRFVAELAAGLQPDDTLIDIRDTGVPLTGARTERLVAPARCRACGKALVTGAERVLGRCEQCPATVDLARLERLRAWRSKQAGAEKVPPYAILTEASLRALAERNPETIEELATIPGLHDAKLRDYGSAMLRVLAG